MTRRTMSGFRARGRWLEGLCREAHARPCNYALRVPCPNGPGAIEVDTTKLPEGSQALAVEAFDAARNVGLSGAVTARVDNTAPGAVPVGVDGGEGWRNANDFDLAWTNPQEGDRAPIVAAHYRVCRPGGSDCTEGSRAAQGIQGISDLGGSGAGEWQARVWLEDAAGNHESANASIPVALRFDSEPPQLAFEPMQATDPTLISVAVTDQTSGLAGGQIELSREGSGSWQTLATLQQGSRLAARVDDAALPAGRYLVRATARRSGIESEQHGQVSGRHARRSQSASARSQRPTCGRREEARRASQGRAPEQAQDRPAEGHKVGPEGRRGLRRSRAGGWTARER